MFLDVPVSKCRQENQTVTRLTDSQQLIQDNSIAPSEDRTTYHLVFNSHTCACLNQGVNSVNC